MNEVFLRQVKVILEVSYSWSIHSVCRHYILSSTHGVNDFYGGQGWYMNRDIYTHMYLCTYKRYVYINIYICICVYLSTCE